LYILCDYFRLSLPPIRRVHHTLPPATTGRTTRPAGPVRSSPAGIRPRVPLGVIFAGRPTEWDRRAGRRVWSPTAT